MKLAPNCAKGDMVQKPRALYAGPNKEDLQHRLLWQNLGGREGRACNPRVVVSSLRLRLIVTPQVDHPLFVRCNCYLELTQQDRLKFCGDIKVTFYLYVEIKFQGNVD